MAKEAEANLAALIESTEDYIWSVDLDYRLITFNRAAKRSLETNLGASLAIGMRPHEFLPPAIAAVWPSLYERALKTGPFRAEYRFANGQFVELSLNPIVADGKATGVSVFVKDIAERKAAEESRTLLASIVESCEDAIHSVNLDGTVISWNRGAEVLFGYKREEIVGKSIATLAPLGRGGEIPQLLGSIANGGSVSPFNTVLRNKEGRDVDVSLSISPIRNLAGTVVGASAIARDISASRKADEAQVLLAAIVESSGDAIHALNLDGTVASWNRGAEKLIGYTSDEIVGKSASILAPSRAWEMLQQDLKAVAQGSSIGPFDAAILRKDGSEVVASISIFPMRNAAGDVVRCSVILRDITQRKQAERELQQAEEKYRKIVDGALEGIFQTNPDGRLLAANSAIAKLLGYESVDDLLSTVKNVATDVFAEQGESVAYLKLLEGHGSVMGFEGRFKRKDGSISWVSINGQRVSKPDGSVSHNEGFVVDITARKSAEAALRESADSLKEAQRIGRLGSYALEFSSGIWASSEVLDELFGIGADYDRTVAGWSDLIHPDDRDLIAAYFAEEVSTKRNQFDKEYRIIRKSDGAERWVHGLGRLDFDDRGKPSRMHGVIKDITERKEVELQLRNSEERYRETFEQAAVGIVHTSFGGEFLRCNARFAEIIGYPLEKISGMTFQQITLPDDLAGSVDVLNELPLAKNGGVNWEKRYIRGDGSLIWVKITVSMQRDAAGQPLHCIAVIEDINDRKIAEDRLAKAQLALEESETRYRTAFQTSLDGIAISHLDDGTYIDVNKAFLEMLSYERAEVVGQSSLQLNLWVDAGDRDSLVERLRRNASFRDVNVRFRKKSGDLIWVLLSCTVMEIKGVPCILTVARDITEAKAAEERLAAAKEAQRMSEARYRAAFQTSPHGVALNRLEDGTYLDVNGAFLDTTGYNLEEVIGQSTLDLNIWVDPGDRDRIVGSLLRNSVFRGDLKFRKKTGEIRWGRMSASLFEHEGVSCILSVTQDITDAEAANERLAEAQAALLRSEERYRTAFQTSLDAITINRVGDGLFIDCNKAFLDGSGYERHEVIGRTARELKLWVDPRDRQTMVEILRQNSSCRDMEVAFRKKNGELYWSRISSSLIELDGAPCMLSVARDISDAKAAAEEIRNLAFYDPLTGLPNRRLLLDRMLQVLTVDPHRNLMHALLLIDLDHFKTLNDTLGHQAGDLMLQEAARRITRCVQENNTVARLVGDEFVVMLEDLSETAEGAAKQAKACAEMVLAAVAQPYLIGDRECRITAGIGVTIFGDGREGADEVLQQADIAMDQAKAEGSNTVLFFSPALQTAVNARAALEAELRHAIDTNQFVLFYQPQVDGAHMIGVEALIRWNHPERGLLLPGEFIALAEETGLILPLGDWVLETACNQIAAWAKRPEPAYVSVAVNISARQFHQPDFVEKVLSALDRSGAAPQNLELELTETLLADSIEEVIAKMTELRAHGLRFSLDDFGTGYSSLAYLKRLPLDQFKIDRTFVQDILLDASSGAIAQTIISLSRAMGLPVIAEGVETEEQRDFLVDLGCHMFQGYLFSHPLALNEFERRWLGGRDCKTPIPIEPSPAAGDLRKRRSIA
jgi:diguanylate cyclase (GGDEF)-like protein/PAS domain S-box-containing protein